MDLSVIPDISLSCADRAERVRRAQARVDTTGMTRPRRDPDERAFLAQTDKLGPFVESSVVIERAKRLDLP